MGIVAKQLCSLHAKVGDLCHQGIVVIAIATVASHGKCPVELLPQAGILCVGHDGHIGGCIEGDGMARIQVSI